MLVLGDKTISNLMVGQQQVVAAYLGNTLVWTKAEPLPYDAEVEYIESTGTQWIDTGFYVQYGTLIHGEGYLNGPSENRVYNYLWGAKSDSYAIGFSGNAANVQYGYCNHGNRVTTVSLTGISTTVGVLTVCEFRVIAENNRQYRYTSPASTIWSTSTASCPGPWGPIVICCNPSTSTPAGAGWKVSKLTCSNISSNEILLDLIPVRFTNELGQTEGAMYDRVSKQLFKNAGSGAFTIGPDKS